jgi:hypothetical protein
MGYAKVLIVAVFNMQDIELAVGAIGGELAIYKYNKVNPWKMCDGLGTV